MKKRILLGLIIGLTTTILLSSCSFGGSNLWSESNDNDQQIAATRLENVLEAIKNKDKDDLKAMFSEKAIAQAENIDQSITDLFNYYQGDFVSYYDWLPGAEQVINGDGSGRNWKRLDSTYDVKTSSGEYRIAIYEFVQDTLGKDNVGVWSLYIIRMEDDIDPKLAYVGDGKETPGINIGLQWVPSQ